MVKVNSKFYSAKPEAPATTTVRSYISSPKYNQSFNGRFDKIISGAKDVFEKAFAKDVHKLDFSPAKIKNADKIFDGRVSEVIDAAKKLGKNIKLDSTFKINGDEITFTDSQVIVKLFKKVAYPIYPGLVKDLPNAIIDSLQKTNAFKNSSWLNSIKDTKFLFNRREQVRAEKVISSLHGIGDKISTATNSGKAQDVLRDFYIKLSGGSHGSYSTQSERALNALATSFVSGAFSARDFYNISRFHDDDHQKAQKSEKDRFKYEAIRGITKALASFATMGALSRFTNSSKTAAIANLMITTLFIEVASRLFSGKALRPLTKEEALAKYNELHKNEPEKIAVQEEKQKEAEVSSSKIGESANKEGANPVKVVFGAIAALFAVGLGKGLLTKYSKPAAKFFGNISDTFAKNMDKLKIRDVKIAKGDFDKVLKELRHADKGKFADILADVTKDNLASDGATYILKSSDTPLGKFANILSGLGAIVVKPFKTGENLAAKIGKKTASFATYQSPEDQKAIVEIINKLGKKISKLEKSGADVSGELKKYINGMVDNGFDINTSMLDNRELIKKFVFFNTLIPSYFSVVDYRNEELIQSKGEVTPRVKEVTNQRILHRIINYFSNRVFIDAYMGIFGSAFNSNLLAATGITALTEFTNESTIRLLTGTPIKKMNKKELDDYYSKETKASGAIRKLMGKKSIKEKAECKK